MRQEQESDRTKPRAAYLIAHLSCRTIEQMIKFTPWRFTVPPAPDALPRRRSPSTFPLYETNPFSHVSPNCETNPFSRSISSYSLLPTPYSLSLSLPNEPIFAAPSPPTPYSLLPTPYSRPFPNEPIFAPAHADRCRLSASTMALARVSRILAAMLAPHPLILASRSPRRQRMLRWLGIPFTTLDVEVDETPRPGEAPADLAARLAHDKALAAIAQSAGRIAQSAGRIAQSAGRVLTADTVVDLDGRTLGKPADAAEARDDA